MGRQAISKAFAIAEEEARRKTQRRWNKTSVVTANGDYENGAMNDPSTLELLSRLSPLLFSHLPDDPNCVT